MIFESDIWFNLCKTVLTTTLALGLMISMTEFRFSGRVLASAYGIYLLYVLASSTLIMWLFGFTVLLNVFLLTITAPAVVITYFLAKDHAMKAIFIYMTQVDICLMLTAPVAVLNQGSKAFDLFLRAALLCTMIAVNYFFIRKPFRRLANILEGNWFFMALVPTAFSVLIVLALKFPTHFTQNPWGLVSLAAIAIAAVIVYFVIFQSLNSSYKLLTYEREKEVLRAQVDAMKGRMESIRQSIEQAAGYRHDLRHHANLLTGLLREGKAEDALVYAQKLGTVALDGGGESYCENLVVNTILAYHMKRARARGMTACCRAVVPVEIGIDEMELCTVLSNLLENAVEHVGGASPQLSVSILQNKGQLCIRIENSFEGTAARDESGNYRSAKQGGGIGLQSVAAIVKKYKGAMNISHTDTAFTVDIAMMSID